jgi:hypothetical protein
MNNQAHNKNMGVANPQPMQNNAFDDLINAMEVARNILVLGNNQP